jgi:hypothetical protein
VRVAGFQRIGFVRTDDQFAHATLETTETQTRARQWYGPSVRTGVGPRTEPYTLTASDARTAHM